MATLTAYKAFNYATLVFPETLSPYGLTSTTMNYKTPDGKFVANVTGSGFRDVNGDHDFDYGTIATTTLKTAGSTLIAVTGMANPVQVDAGENGYTVDGKALKGAMAELAYWLRGNDLVNGSEQVDRLAGFAGNDALYGKGGNDILEGWSGNDTLNGGAGTDTLYGGAGTDRFVFDSRVGADAVRDFATRTDKLVFDNSGLGGLGDRDGVLEGGLLRTAASGFAKTAELVVFSSNISGTITNALAAAKIGNATSAYTVGDQRVFVVDNGLQSNAYLFKAADADAAVESHELTLLGTINGQTGITDYLFQV